MNYLVSLSFTTGNPEAILGALIAETGRSTRLSHFEGYVRTGIELHLEIRDFLEKHSITEKNLSRLPFLYTKHNREIIETFLDHFMAVQWRRYQEIPFEESVRQLHEVTDLYSDVLHSKLRKVNEALKNNNWFYHHYKVSDMHRFAQCYIELGLCRINIGNSILKLMEHYSIMKIEFDDFYSELHAHILKHFPAIKVREAIS